MINFFHYAGPDKVNPEHILDLEVCVRVITKMRLRWESYFSPHLLYDYDHNDWNLRHRFTLLAMWRPLTWEDVFDHGELTQQIPSPTSSSSASTGS